jgi:hypothetical protein
MKNVICLIMILIGNMASAEWLCTETSSVRSDNTITSCGVAKSVNLEDARNQAREAAVNEFNQLCKISVDCNNHNYVVVPQRTDCQVHGSEVVCYRALEFQILETMKSDVPDEDIQKDLEQTRTQIDELQKKLSTARQLQYAKRQVEITNRQIQSATSGDDGYYFQDPPAENVMKFGVSYWNGNLTSNSEADLALNIAYEARVTKWLGIQLEFSQGGDMSGTNGAPTTGTPGTHVVSNGSMSFNTLSLSTLVYTGISNTYVKPEVGVVEATRNINTTTFSSIGTGSTTTQQETVSKTFSGVSIGFDSRDNAKGWGAYAEIGARVIDSNIGVTSAIGLSYGF